MKRLSVADSVLLVVDVQGKLAQRAVNSEQLHKRITAMVLGCVALKVPVLYTEQLPDKLGDTSPSIKEALVSANAARFVKRTFSCVGLDVDKEWNNNQLRERLRDVSQVMLCGIEGHICVMQTCLDLLGGGKDVHVLSDCTSSQRQSDLDLGLRRMEVRHFPGVVYFG